MVVVVVAEIVVVMGVVVVVLVSAVLVSEIAVEGLEAKLVIRSGGEEGSGSGRSGASEVVRDVRLDSVSVWAWLTACMTAQWY